MAHAKHPHHHDETKAERIAREAKERELERVRTLNERSQQNRGVEKDADLAPHENLTPNQEHRGGPLPNQTP